MDKNPVTPELSMEPSQKDAEEAAAQQPEVDSAGDKSDSAEEWRDFMGVYQCSSAGRVRNTDSATICTLAVHKGALSYRFYVNGKSKRIQVKNAGAIAGWRASCWAMGAWCRSTRRWSR